MFRSTVLLLGYSAAFIGALTYIPQLLHIMKTKQTQSISLTTYLILDLVTFLWFMYGILDGDMPLIINTSLVMICSLSITFLKLKHG